LKNIVAAALAACAVLAAPPALPQSAKFPDKPVRFIVPFPPGGGNDILARVLAPKMAESLGQLAPLELRDARSAELEASGA